MNRLKKADWEVRNVSLSTGRRLVKEYHYAGGGSNTATYLHGLFKKTNGIFDNECVGVAWWIPPTKSAAKATFPENWQGVLSLSRLVIKPEVLKNACTFLLARSRALIDRKRWPCLVTKREVNMSKHYILDGHNVKEANLSEWAKWYETTDRRVKRETVGGSDISTVFLGLDHRFSGDGPPIIFETLVFGGPLDQEMERYSTWEEAEAGHRAMVEKVKKAAQRRPSIGIYIKE